MEQIIMEMQPWAFNASLKNKLRLIQDAIRGTRLLTISYRNYANETSARQIEPMTLVFKGYVWYLFAFCRLKNDYRLFRISRISALTPEDELFARRNGSYREHGELSKTEAGQVSVTLRFSASARTRVEDLFDRKDIQVLKTGELLVTAQFPEGEWHLNFILSFGGAVEVLGPESVRQTIIEKIRIMNSIYQKKFQT